jgi:hypothetical protein
VDLLPNQCATIAGISICVVAQDRVLQPEAEMIANKVDWRNLGPGPVTCATFSRSVAGALAAVRPDLTCHPEGAALQLRTVSGHAWEQDLSQVYEIYLGQPSLLDSLVRLAVASICDRATLDTAHAGASLGLLLPVVRRREALADSDVLFEPFARSLAETFVLDHPSGQTLVTAAIQERLTSSAAELRATARANLNDRLGEVTIDRLGGGVSLICSETLAASSLLFSDVFWRCAQLTGKALFAIPSDVQTLVVFEGQDTKVRDRAVATALEIMDASPSPLTTEVVAIADLRLG